MEDGEVADVCVALAVCHVKLGLFYCASLV